MRASRRVLSACPSTVSGHIRARTACWALRPVPTHQTRVAAVEHAGARHTAVAAALPRDVLNYDALPGDVLNYDALPGDVLNYDAVPSQFGFGANFGIYRAKAFRNGARQPREPPVRADKDDAFWERAERWQEEDAVLTAVISGLANGGAVVMCEGYEGFIPSRFLGKDLRRDAASLESAGLKGQEVQVKVLDIRKAKYQLLLRRWPPDQEPPSEEAFDRCKVGYVMEGTVQGVQPYGAFIDLGCGVTGLLHISHVSRDRVAAIDKVFKEGDEVKAMVLNVEKELGRVTLSTARLERTPGDMLRDPQLVYGSAEEIAATFRRNRRGELNNDTFRTPFGIM